MVGGMGLPELLVILSTLVIPLILIVVGYFLVKHAVKRGTIEAYEELKRDGKL
ncbi:MAG: hypothetical protein IKV48_08130 [Eggerthellaceae bacterium]|nr:hypothetical protein [Eggerthellaceae bacterium]